MKNIPNIFTLLNLFFGCLAIVFILQNGFMVTVDAEGAQWLDLHEKIWMASLFIGIAAIVDFLDGFLARAMHAVSPMGKQLDSLADVVSFGVAPGMILYQFLRLSIAKEPTGIDASIIWLMPAFVLPCAAAWRLARFNLDDSQSHSFKGLPVPAVGIFFASLPLIYWNVNQQWVNDLLINKWFLYALIAMFSWLMVSNLPLLALKFKDFGVKNNLPRYLLLLFGLLFVVFFRWMGIPLAIAGYIVLSLIFSARQ